MQFSVHFTIEADSLEEAEASIGEWVVTPNTVLHSITGSQISDVTPLYLAEGGQVSRGEKPELPPIEPIADPVEDVTDGE
jgi:hypothetical protein